MVDHSPQLWCLQGGGSNFKLLCPKYIAAMLSQTLMGWQITKIENAQAASPIISVLKGEDGYFVDALVIERPSLCIDLIDVLNEVFVCLAYLYHHQRAQGDLIHCAAYIEGGENHIVVGPKNSGKSTLAHDKAKDGLHIFADDLLFWDPITGQFITLGLPLRLRRPVVMRDGQPADPSHFFAGRSIAYSKQGVFDIAPMGYAFCVDRLWYMQPDHQVKAISLIKTASTLREFRIPKYFSSLKKQTLEVTPWQNS